MTKLEVLQRLRQANGAYVSSAELCRELSLSRNSVWKAVNRLREEGYPITAVTNRGYRLEPEDGEPAPLEQHAIEKHLQTHVLGKKLLVLPTVSSTNAYARPLADDPQNEGLTILSELQTAGRGRNGRRFESAEGGLYFSVILQPKHSTLALPALRQAVVDAVMRGIRQETGVETTFLPPNELFVDGKKLCGILTEVRIESESERISSMIVGIGIYCNNRPFAAGDARTSLWQCCGQKVDRAALAAAILNGMEEQVLALKKGEGTVPRHG